MKVHHLNCGTTHPPAAPAIVRHVLLLETDRGLVLVDTGFGLRDIADPARRIGPIRHLLRPVFSPDETAAHQCERLGYRRDDVRHIVTTTSTSTTSAVGTHCELRARIRPHGHGLNGFGLTPIG